MPLSLQISALAVSAIYYVWRDVYAARLQKEKDCRLCQRVAYMVWVVALHDIRPPADPPAPPTAV